MHYWIDGYNLLFRLPKSKGSFEEKRRTLIREINQQVKALSLSATIVFDASDPSQTYDTRSHFDSLEIVYTHPRKSADDAILEAIEMSSKKAFHCVVTSDKGLALKAKAMGAHILSLSEFLHFLEKKHLKSKTALQEPEWRDSPREIQRLLRIFSNPPKEI